MNASEMIDKQIAEAAGWRGPIMARLRTLIHEADPDIIEEWKWETGVFSHQGQVCLVNAFKKNVKMTFPKGAGVADAHHLFNAGLGGKAWRSIDFHEGDEINEAALRDLVRAAVAYNTGKA